MDFDSGRLLFRGRKIAEPVSEGSEEGLIKFDVPVQHFALWGQPVSYFGRVVGFEDANLDYALFVKFSKEPVLSRAASLSESEVGDSFLELEDDSLELGVIVSGDPHRVILKINAHRRIGGFEINPVRLRSANETIKLGMEIAYGMQRSAAISGVPLYIESITARRVDRAESESRMTMPYPTVAFQAPSKLPFPAVDLLLNTLAEGRRDNSPFYRALVFFKIIEAFIDRIQPALTKLFHSCGLQLDQYDLTLPEDPFNKIKAELVGMKYSRYRTIIQGRIRDVIAHLDPNSPIAAFDVNAESEVTTASIVLHYIASHVVEHLGASLIRLAQTHKEQAVAFSFSVVDKRRKRSG